MAKRLQVEIVTPDRRVLQREVEDIYLPGPRGEMGVLTDHAALLATISAGVVRLRDGSEISQLAIRGGFIQIRDNRVMLLADQAVLPEEVDRSEIEKESQILEQKLVDADVDVEERETLIGDRDWVRARLEIVG